MINILNFIDKYVFTYENALAFIILALSLFFMKADADLSHLKNQAIAHGFAKYDEVKGNWRWVTEEDMLK